MATFAVGDVHGCQSALERLLARLPFDPDGDRLWMVGDLVNRGPDSLATLRWARRTEERLGDRFVAVLGNHDVHLLAYAAGLRREKPRDTLSEITSASDGDELVEWLAARPLLHREAGWTLVHAGLLPGWAIAAAAAAARRTECVLRGPRRELLLSAPAAGEGELASLRRSLDAFTRLRMLDRETRPHDFSGAPEEAPPGLVPWFRHPNRRSEGERIVCGHWSALGLHRENGVLLLDTGCVWDRELTAVRLDDGATYSVPAG